MYILSIFKLEKLLLLNKPKVNFILILQTKKTYVKRANQKIDSILFAKSYPHFDLKYY